MPLLHRGNIVLQGAIKGVSGQVDPLVTHISVAGTQDGSAFESAKNAVAWQTENFTTGLALSGTEQFSINKGAGGNITIDEIKLYFDDNGVFIEVGEVDTTSTLFTASGQFTVQTLTLNFPSVAYTEFQNLG